MLTPIESTLLKEFLANLPYPEQALSYHELMGFMYGLAITPGNVPQDEWLSAVFNQDQTSVPADALTKGMDLILMQVYDAFMNRKRRGELHFPYQVENLQDSDLDEILEWSFGFEEALALRPEIWEPEVEPEHADPEDEELFFSMMVLHGLNDPVDVLPVFEQIPEDIADSMKVFDKDAEDRDLQLQAFFIATLPLAVQSLQDYGKKLEQDNTTTRPGKPKPSPLQQRPPKSGTGRKGKIIQVDFTRKTKT